MNKSLLHSVFLLRDKFIRNKKSNDLLSNVISKITTIKKTPNTCNNNDKTNFSRDEMNLSMPR